jgi:tetratricopeptide (TPR) repeat protein
MNDFLGIRWDVGLVQLVCALPLALLLAGVLRKQPAAMGTLAWTLLAPAVLALVVPWVYREARWRHDLRELQGLLEQSRLGEAQPLATMLARLDNRAALSGVVPLKRLADEIDQTVSALQARAARPLAADAGDGDRISRAQDLAMLGRTDEALHVLAAAPALANSPVACNLRGTIHETRRQWRQARDWYSKAKTDWEQEPDTPEQTAGLIRATTGIGFAERKLGRYREAEAAYQQVLALAPTADSHFLLARFYEDTQQASKAQQHARAAMSLDPGRYLQPAGVLIDKLVTLHFGCWGVRSAEFHGQSSPP